MRLFIRQLINKCFCTLSFITVVLIVAMLLVILVPIFKNGATAIFFDGTVEFRKMQFSIFNRGDRDKINAEDEIVQAARKPVYDILDDFKKGINTDGQVDTVRSLYREYGRYLRDANIEEELASDLKSEFKSMRNLLQDAYESIDRDEINEKLDAVLANQTNEHFKDNEYAAQYFQMANRYKHLIVNFDFSKREEYAQSLYEVEEVIILMFGPRPGEPLPVLSMNQYGATRWDMAQDYLDRLLYKDKWVEVEPGKPMQKTKVSRKEQFAGTEMVALIEMIERDMEKMLNPQSTYYWQYFIDDSTPGHYFGGVGPEILGTILMTVIAMVIAVPFGIVSAAFLVEYGKDTIIIRIIRTCVNTLAGVPSIVFGLFGMIFFVLYILPLFNKPSMPCILTASLTLALLILPVIIRASEEAIRSVPRTYQEASLSLGAGRFKTFVSVTLPAALPGILTGIILSLGRAAGETAPILFTGAVALGPVPDTIMEPSRTLSYGILDIAISDKIAMLVPHQQYGMVVTLIMIVLLLNLVAILLRSRISKKLRGY